MAQTLVSAQRADLALARTRGQLTELKSELAVKDGEIEALLHHVRDRVGPAASTALTYGGAAVAGFIDGFLGEKNLIGPVPIVAALGFSAAVASVVIEEPNLAEATAALARGMGSPTIYTAVKNATTQHFWKDGVKQEKHTPTPTPKPAPKKAGEQIA